MGKSKFVAFIKNAIKTPQGRGDYDDDEEEYERDYYDEQDSYDAEDSLYAEYEAAFTKPKFNSWKSKYEQEESEIPSYSTEKTKAETSYEPKYQPKQDSSSSSSYGYSERPTTPSSSSKVFQFEKTNPGTAKSTKQKFKFALLKIDKIEMAVTVADCMLSNNTVALFDMHDIPENNSRRVIDFLDGVRYTCNARIEMIADRVFVVVPESVELSGDFLSQVDTNGIRF